VNKEWKRLIDNHRLLLNHLDFSDPLLSISDGRLTEAAACQIITRSRHRLHHLSIWNHGGVSPLSNQMSTTWSIDNIINVISSIGVLPSLSFISLYGHVNWNMNRTQDHMAPILSILNQSSSSRSKCIELVTCPCVATRWISDIMIDVDSCQHLKG
jgi:hypothetical protein